MTIKEKHDEILCDVIAEFYVDESRAQIAEKISRLRAILERTSAQHFPALVAGLALMGKIKEGDVVDAFEDANYADVQGASEVLGIVEREAPDLIAFFPQVATGVYQICQMLDSAT